MLVTGPKLSWCSPRTLSPDSLSSESLRIALIFSEFSLTTRLLTEMKVESASTNEDAGLVTTDQSQASKQTPPIYALEYWRWIVSLNTSFQFQLFSSQDFWCSWPVSEKLGANFWASIFLVETWFDCYFVTCKRLTDVGNVRLLRMIFSELLDYLSCFSSVIQQQHIILTCLNIVKTSFQRSRCRKDVHTSVERALDLLYFILKL